MIGGKTPDQSSIFRKAYSDHGFGLLSFLIQNIFSPLEWKARFYVNPFPTPIFSGKGCQVLIHALFSCFNGMTPGFTLPSVTLATVLVR